MEVMKSYGQLVPTYRELAEALKQLSFKDMSTKDTFNFVNDKFEAVVVLPLKKDDVEVHLARFVAISYNLADLGVIPDVFDLGKTIEQYRLQEKNAAA